MGEDREKGPESGPKGQGNRTWAGGGETDDWIADPEHQARGGGQGLPELRRSGQGRQSESPEGEAQAREAPQYDEEGRWSDATGGGGHRGSGAEEDEGARSKGRYGSSESRSGQQNPGPGYRQGGKGRGINPK